MGGGVWSRDRRFGRRLRPAERRPDSSRVAGLACGGVRRGRLVDQEHRSLDRDFGDLSTELAQISRAAGARPGQRASSVGTAFPSTCRSDPGFAAGGKRLAVAQNGRAPRPSATAARTMAGDQRCSGSELRNVEGGGPAPSRDLHDPSSGSALPQLHDIRRSSSSSLRRHASPHQLAAPGPDAAERPGLRLEAADALAKLITDLLAASDRDRLVYAFRRTVTRTPSAVELQELTRLLNEFRGTSGNESEAWVSLARVLLNLDETITKS